MICACLKYRIKISVFVEQFLQTFIGMNEMTSVVDGEVKKQKGAFDYDIFELKLDFSSELESFVKSQFFWFPWQSILSLISLVSFVLWIPSLQQFVFQLYLSGH
jgi:hypothetical protein